MLPCSQITLPAAISAQHQVISQKNDGARPYDYPTGRDICAASGNLLEKACTIRSGVASKAPAYGEYGNLLSFSAFGRKKQARPGSLPDGPHVIYSI